ncbi:hypothetical protein SUGI_1474460 [Cryptomeria japonica]|uniref:Uncharacterized protein n=1 Tax=Cryptomeria japonica TaxID=3369 RepID=A0AAD3NN60_CRYJA|nr:hypothetical protein SUGI_1469340 [Cryptomeria japonica]GLJ58760.1 hypothetical protein SUGI_1474460 [Cryptomeria japonica]
MTVSPVQSEHFVPMNRGRPSLNYRVEPMGDMCHLYPPDFVSDAAGRSFAFSGLHLGQFGVTNIVRSYSRPGPIEGIGGSTDVAASIASPGGPTINEFIELSIIVGGI